MFAVLTAIVTLTIMLQAGDHIYKPYAQTLQPPKAYIIQPWMPEAVRKDLAPIAKPITPEQLDHTFDDIKVGALSPYYSIVRLQIIDGVLYGPPLWKGLDRTAKNFYKIMLQVLQHIASSGQLKHNVDFLLSLDDFLPADIEYLKPGALAPILVTTKKISALRERPGRSYEIMYPDPLSFGLEPTYKLLLNGRSKKPNQWANKQDIVFWNGSNSSGGEYSIEGVKNDPRIRLVQLSKARPDLVSAGFFLYRQLGRDRNVNDYITSNYPKVKRVSIPDHQHYKYLITLDGATCTFPGYLWRLASNSLTMKQETDNMQWYYHLLQPYVHYIPLKYDISDLEEKIIYMRKHDQEMQEIVKNANRLIEQNLQSEHLYGYMVELLNQYAAKQGDIVKKPNLISASILLEQF